MLISAEQGKHLKEIRQPNSENDFISLNRENDY
jgi:hypothetical protein